MTTIVERLGRVTNLVHGFIYFAPEATNRFESLGLSATQQYFAGRAAPMGAVGAELVVATFFNFNPAAVRAAIPQAWSVASPAAVQNARLDAAQEVLHRTCGDLNPADVARATGIAQAMVDGVGDEGKPLAAANRAAAMPADALGRLWQLVTIIREWRGDAHVAVLSAAPVTGIEALVLHAATGQVPGAVLRTTRSWSEQDWDDAVTALAERGLVRADGSFTDRGAAFRTDIEEATNRAASPLVQAVGDNDAQEFCDLLRPIRSALIATGVFARPLGSVRLDQD